MALKLCVRPQDMGTIDCERFTTIRAFFVVKTPKTGNLFFKFYSTLLLVLCVYAIWEYTLTGWEVDHNDPIPDGYAEHAHECIVCWC